MLHVCQPGYETFLAKELEAPLLAKGPGWVRAADAPAPDPCFAHYALRGEKEVAGDSGRALARALVDYFLESSRGEAYDAPWPLLVEGAGVEGAARRAHGVEALFFELAKKRMARVIRLAVAGRPAPGPRRGLVAFLTAPGRLWAAREGVFGGQRRMADDPRAPSRSFLKIEEAYAVLGEAPREGETVVDLGAAPGGWSYSAAKRGAKVVAVDNGPLKAGAAGNPLVEHRSEDAFKCAASADWLFCDMIEDPDKVLELVSRWVSQRRCRRFVVNLKFGRLDPLPLLRRARALAPHCERLLARHLYHDRQELTILGTVRG